MSKKSGEIEITNSTGKAYFDFKRAMAEITDTILNSAAEALEMAKEDAAHFAAEDLKTESLQHGWSHYAKGWTVRVERSKKQNRYIVHNATHYQLTHLLEKGHRIIRHDGTDTGKRTAAEPHIAPVNDKVPDIVDECFTTYIEGRLYK